MESGKQNNTPLVNSEALQEPTQAQLQEIMRLQKMMYEALYHDQALLDDPIVADHLSADFTAEVDLIEGTFTWYQWSREALPQYRRDNPQYPPELLNESIDWNRETGVATVWHMIRTTTFPEAVVKDGMAVHSWRREDDGIWRNFKSIRYRSGFGHPMS